MYIVQDCADDKSFEIVFRKWEGELPLPRNVWEGELGDDRYEACKASCKNGEWQWKAFLVSPDRVSRAKELVLLAKKKFEELYDVSDTGQEV